MNSRKGERPTDPLLDANSLMVSMCLEAFRKIKGHPVASIFKRSNKDTWVIKWKEVLQGGRKLWHSDQTRLTDRTQALRLAEACEEAGRRVDREPRSLSSSSTSDPNEPPSSEGAKAPGETSMPTHTPVPRTVGEVVDWHVEVILKKRSRQPNRSRLDKHILPDPIAGIPLSRLTTADVNAFLLRLRKKEVGAPTINMVRSLMHSAVNRAIEHGFHDGTNPISNTREQDHVAEKREWVREHEVDALLANIDQEWRNQSAVALYMGLRKGEVFGLRRKDVDLDRKEMTVLMSWNEVGTKGGRGDVLPIPDVLMPFLEDALRKSEGNALVFPNSKGRMRNRFCDAAGAVREGAAKAGIDRELDFHCLRHSCASILASKGVPMHIIQRILRHSSIELTNNTYAHLQQDSIRAALNG